MIMKDASCKIIDEDKNWIMYKFLHRNIYYLENNSSDFIMDRECFEYLDFNKFPYSIILYNKMKKRYFYLDLKKEFNWVKSCFESCDKEKIHLGKQVLNYEISEENLKKKIGILSKQVR